LSVFTDNLHFDDEYVKELERKIDAMTEELPPLTNFILPVSCEQKDIIQIAYSVLVSQCDGVTIFDMI